jgi:hypothetical protein
MSHFFGRDVMGELPIFAHVPLPELEVVAAVMRMESKRPTMTEKRLLPLDFSKVSGLAHRGSKRPKAAESQQFDEDRLRSKCIFGSTKLILGRGNTSNDGLQFRSDTCVKGPEEIVSDVLFTRRTAALGARLHSSMAHSERLRVSKGKPVFPLVEQDAYDYVVELHLEGGAPPTWATRFREMVAFTKSVIGADGAMAVLASGREVKYMQAVLSLWTQPVWCRLCRCLLAAASLCMLCRCLVAAVCLRHAVSLPLAAASVVVRL